MDLLFFSILCSINFVSLVIVSVVLLVWLRRREKLYREAATKVLKREEGRLSAVLDELSNISTVIYQDIAKRKNELKRILTEVDEKILLLEKAAVDLRSTKRSLDKEYSFSEPREKTIQVKTVRKVVPKPQEQQVQSTIRSPLFDTVGEKIVTLAKKGFSIADIAKAVERPKGEVELILHLREVTVEQ